MMRKLLTFIGSLFFAVALLGQAPASFKYQSVLRDSRGNFRANSSINIRIDIIQGSVSGATVFSENHSVTTDDFGLIALEIGNGIPIKNTLSAINWGTDTYFIRIFVEGIEMGTSQLLSVPYALHANTAQKLIGGITETDPNFASHPANGISSTNIINWNTAASWGDHASAGYLKSYPEILARSIDLTSKVNGLLPGANGGTGVANTGKTITLGGNIATTGDLTTTGAYSTTLNATETTSVTLPTKGTLATLGGVESITGLKTFTKDKIAMVGTSTGSTTLSTANISATNYTITLPAATGTIALTSDIARETMSNFPGTLAGDVTGTQGATVVGKINGISLARLSTGILKNTTISGFPSIAAADDFPVLNQNTNGTAANVTGIVAISNGGTGSITKIFVDLSTVQTVAGNKTLSGNTSIGGTLAVTGVATLTAAPVLSSATALQALFTNANNNVVSNAITGSGSVVMSDSPDLKGVPVAPTAAAGTNTTQIATTAFVLANGGTAPNGTTLPDAGATGATFYDTTSSNYYVSNGTTWNMVAAPDATTKETGKIQLAGDLSGTAALPVIAAGAVDNSKISELAGIVDSKLATISTAGKISNSATTATSANTLNAIVLRDASGDFATRTIIGNLTGNVTGNLTGNVTGNVSGTAANVTGVVAIANGGTGQTTALGAKTSLGLDNVDNTSDANKPVSSTQLTALNLKENTANKSTATALGTSDLLFPTQNAVKSYVDAQINNTTPDATTLFKGKVQLAGDLAGTAALPVIAAGAVDNSKISELAGIVDSKLATISTAGKISNTATTATSANTLNAIV